MVGLPGSRQFTDIVGVIYALYILFGLSGSGILGKFAEFADCITITSGIFLGAHIGQCYFVGIARRDDQTIGQVI